MLVTYVLQRAKIRIMTAVQQIDQKILNQVTGNRKLRRDLVKNVKRGSIKNGSKPV